MTCSDPVHKHIRNHWLRARPKITVIIHNKEKEMRKLPKVGDIHTRPDGTKVRLERFELDDGERVYKTYGLNTSIGHQFRKWLVAHEVMVNPCPGACEPPHALLIWCEVSADPIDLDSNMSAEQVRIELRNFGIDVDAFGANLLKKIREVHHRKPYEKPTLEPLTPPTLRKDS